MNTIYFQGGGTSSLNSNLLANYIVVDSNSTLQSPITTKLNTQGNSFTTQNGGKLSMTNPFDTLDVAGGTAYFNGGTSTLTAGDIEFQDLLQGYAGVGLPVATASANSFSPTSGVTAHLNSGCCGGILFLNPGTGPTLSHFWYLQLSTSSTNTLYSNVVSSTACSKATSPGLQRQERLLCYRHDRRAHHHDEGRLQLRLQRDYAQRRGDKPREQHVGLEHIQ